MARVPRYERLEGIGRIRAYDSGGRTMDRYLVLFEDFPTVTDTRTYTEIDRPRPYGPRFALGMSEDPGHPQGVGWTDYVAPPQTWGTGAEYRRIPFAALPERCQRAVRDMASWECPHNPQCLAHIHEDEATGETTDRFDCDPECRPADWRLAGADMLREAGAPID